MKRIVLCTALLLSLAAPAAALAQAPVPVAPGTRVRVSLSDGTGPEWVVGNVVDAGPDSLVINLEGPEYRRTLRPGEIGALQVSRGRRTRGQNAGRTGVRAGAAGAALGAGLGALLYRKENHNDYALYDSRGTAAIFYGVLLGVPSAVVGAVVGAAAPGERWVPARLPLHAVAAGPVPGGGVGVSFSLKL